MSSTAASIFPISLGPPQDPSTSSYLHLSGHAGPSSKPYKNPGADDEDEYDDDEDDEGMLEDDYDDDEGGDGGAMMLDDEQGSGRPGRITTAGEPIASSATFMRGHGSYLAAPPRRKEDRYADDDDQQDGQSGAKATANNTNGISTTSELIYSSLAGLVLRTNKLISVRSLRSRYTPEVGDLVVGRIVEVQPGAKRWKVDIASRQDASLALSSINLPGGVQRKKLESDELQMRTFFKEGDLLVAEVQSVFHDGSVALHTRSLRYGKLRNGELAQVQSNLIQRLKSHFLHLDKAGVDLTIGMNGWVWCSKHIAFDVDAVEAEGKGPAYEGKGIGGAGVGMDIDAGAGVYGDANEDISAATRRAIAHVRSILTLLSDRHIAISDVSIARAYDIWVENLQSRSGLATSQQPQQQSSAKAGQDSEGGALLEAARDQESLLRGAKGGRLVQLMHRTSASA